MKNRGLRAGRCFARGFLPTGGIPYFYAEIPQLINVARFNWIRFWRSGENLRNVPGKAQKTRPPMPKGKLCSAEFATRLAPSRRSGASGEGSLD